MLFHAAVADYHRYRDVNFVKEVSGVENNLGPTQFLCRELKGEEHTVLSTVQMGAVRCAEPLLLLCKHTILGAEKPLLYKAHRGTCVT